MPIRPENRGRYPADWAAISNRIRFERAEGRCECTGECGRPATHLAVDGRCWNHHGHEAWITGSMVVLTCAHLNHDPTDNRDENLRGWCQGCHLHRDHHAETRAVTRRRERAERGEMELDFLPYDVDLSHIVVHCGCREGSLPGAHH